MSHQAQQSFVSRTRDRFPEHFNGANVLEAGSYNVNGTVRDYFTSCQYVGIDVAPGPCVDLVCPAQDYKSDRGLDTVISCEMMEHNPHWEASLNNMLDLLVPGGLLVLTCATTGRPEHGTLRTWRGDSPSSSLFGNYYRNLTEADFRSVLNTRTDLSLVEFSFDAQSCDIYLLARKKGQISIKRPRATFTGITTPSVTERQTQVFYHLYCVNDYYARFLEFYATLACSGLLKKSSLLHVVAVGPGAQEAETLIPGNFDKVVFYRPVGPGADLSERATLEVLYRVCATEDINALYAHAKGVTAPRDLPQKSWADMMRYYCVERHEDAIRYLEWYDAVGVQLMQCGQQVLYTGNFWWSKSSHIRKLPVLPKDCSRTGCANWLGEAKSFKFLSLDSFPVNPSNEVLPRKTYEGKPYVLRCLISHGSHAGTVSSDLDSV